MRVLKIVAPVTVLALLTGGCGFFASHTDATPHASGSALKRVWKISNGSIDSDDAGVVGDTVMANFRDKLGEPTRKGVFIDGRTGRIRGRATNVDTEDIEPATDKHGRALIGDGGGTHERVYDPSGHLIWQARARYEHFVGGYMTKPEKSGGKYWQVIRTTSGRLVTRLPGPKGITDISQLDGLVDVQAVRPGLLMATGFGPSGSQAALVDVSQPSHARLRPLHPPPPPPTPSHHGPISPGPGPAAVSSGHVYVRWGVTYGKDDKQASYIAGYHIPGTRPAWHVSLPGGASPWKIEASPSGPETLAVMGGTYSGERVWFLRPDTGALIGPKPGRKGQLHPYNGLAGGHAYIDAEASGTQVIDPRTGSLVRTIPGPGSQSFLGATSSGYLIYGGPDGLDAYR